MANMETIPENEPVQQSTDLSQLYSTLTAWTFTFDRHNPGLINEKICELCREVEANLISQGHGPATQFDVQNTRTATDFLMRNKNLFTVAKFMACLDITSIAYNELSSAIYGNAPNVNLSVEESAELLSLRSQVQKLTFDKNALELKQSQITAAEVAKGLATIKVPGSSQVFKFSNPSSTPLNPNPLTSSPIPASPFSAPGSGASSSGLTMSSLEAQLMKLTQIVEHDE